MNATAMIAKEFDARITDHPGQSASWVDDSETIQQGELWISKDLAAFVHPQSEWIEGRPLYADDFTSLDAGKLRCFRRLNQDWYCWLFHAISARRGSEQWPVLKERANQLWSIACRWWGNHRVGVLHRTRPSSDYQPPKPRTI